MKIRNLFLALLVVCAIGPANADVAFGRLYTTPKQREQLDDARTKLANEEIVIDITKENTPVTEDEEDETVTSSSISLDGIVYRSDGKNTAWINRSSTNEGNLETQFTKVGEKDVQSNRVNITLPDNQTRINLKVGEQYNINSREISDMMKDPATTTPATSPEPRR